MRFIPAVSAVQIRSPLPNNRPHGQAVKTSPFHGGIRGSNPRGVTNFTKNDNLGRIAQLGEHLPYKQGVIGSSPIVSTKLRPGSSVG